ASEKLIKITAVHYVKSGVLFAIIVCLETASGLGSEKIAPAPPLGAPVIVTATAGVVGPTTYGTLGGPGGAFAAINNGTHQGSITIEILSPGTVEAGPAILNGSGAGAASYSSVLIRPVNDAVTVAGPTATGRGLVELNGASNVTIDGDNPNTP